MYSEELIIVIVVITVSTLYATDIGKRYNPQLVFILLVMGIILLYKTLKSCFTNAPFQNFANEIGEFLQKDMPSANSAQDVADYKSGLSALQSKIDKTNELLSNLDSQLKNKDNGSLNLSDQYNIQASQQIQDYQIRNITEEIKRANDLIKESKLREDSKKYKKIPVISSCIISEADGSLSYDDKMAVQSGIKSSTGPTSSSSVKSSVPSPFNSTSGPGNNSNKQSDELTIQKLLESVAINGINVSVKND